MDQRTDNYCLSSVVGASELSAQENPLQSPMRIEMEVRSRMIGEFSVGKLVPAIEDTYYELLAVLQTGIPGGFWRREPDMIFYCSGFRVPMLNGILGPRFNADNASARIESAMAHFKRTQVPMRWLLGPSSSPPNLGEILSRRGLKEGWAIPGMVLDLKTITHEPLPAGVDIQEATDTESLRTCGNTLAEGFEFRGEVAKGVSDAVMSYGISPTRRWFLGLQDGGAVSVSLVILHDMFAGIYCVATVPEARGKGLGYLITREPLFLAKSKGYDLAVLEASSMGFPVYKRIGFEQICEFRTFVWSP